MTLQLHWSPTIVDTCDLITGHVSTGEPEASKQLLSQLVADTCCQDHDCEKLHAIGLLVYAHQARTDRPCHWVMQGS